MGSRWLGIVVDAHDPARLARWWAEVLGYHITFEEPDLVAIAGAVETQPGIAFVPVPEAKTAKNRIHIDLAPDDQAAEIERLVDMGARHVDIGQPESAAWVVLADPEGNEFCLLRSQKPAA
jgi:predicted enzyme related to lactoylglutathione lyase